MTDTQTLNWIEAVGAQVWRDRKGQWTCQVIVNGHVIQPTRSSLRMAILDAQLAYQNETTD